LKYNIDWASEKPIAYFPFAILLGSCKAVAIDDCTETVLNIFQAGEFLGEIGLLMNIPRTATVVACEKSLLLG